MKIAPYIRDANKRQFALEVKQNRVLEQNDVSHRKTCRIKDPFDISSAILAIPDLRRRVPITFIQPLCRIEETVLVSRYRPAYVLSNIYFAALFSSNLENIIN